MEIKMSVTLGEKYGPAMEIKSQKKADKYFEALVQHSIKHGGLERKKAKRVERGNLGYYSGYYTPETRARVLKLFKCKHPTSGDLYGDYGNKTEFILFAHKGRRLLNGKRGTNVLNYPRCSNLKHPTEKPLDLCAYLIEKSSNPEDLVLDPFVGSGTTGIAAVMLGRKFIGIEINQKYAKEAEARIKGELGLFV